MAVQDEEAAPVAVRPPGPPQCREQGFGGLAPDQSQRNGRGLLPRPVQTVHGTAAARGGGRRSREEFEARCGGRGAVTVVDARDTGPGHGVVACRAVRVGPVSQDDRIGQGPPLLGNGAVPDLDAQVAQAPRRAAGLRQDLVQQTLRPAAAQGEHLTRRGHRFDERSFRCGALPHNRSTPSSSSCTRRCPTGTPRPHSACSSTRTRHPSPRVPAGHASRVRMVMPGLRRWTVR